MPSARILFALNHKRIIGIASGRLFRSWVKLNYFPETDSLYIDLSEQPSAESREISEGCSITTVMETSSVSTSTMPAGRSI